MQDTQRKNKNHNLEMFLAVAELPNYFFVLGRLLIPFTAGCFPSLNVAQLQDGNARSANPAEIDPVWAH